MSTNVGDLYLNLKLDVKNLQEGINKTQKELKKVNASTKKTAQGFQVMNNNMVRSIRRMETFVVAAVSVYHAFDNIILAGIRLNQQYEDQALGIAALTSAKLKMVDATGKQLSSYDQFIATQAMTKDVMDDIKKAALETPASFQQMVGFYQQSIGHAITENQTFGKSIEDVNKNVILFTQRMSALGSAAGMEMTKVNEEIRSLMSGNASTDSLLAMMLFGSPTQANEAVRNAKKSTDGLSTLLLGALEPFKNVEGVVTYTKAIAQMGAAMDEIRREGLNPMFEDLKALAQEMRDYVNTNQDSLIASWQDAYDKIRGVVTVIVGGLSDINDSMETTLTSTSDIFDGMNAWVKVLGIVRVAMAGLAMIMEGINIGMLQTHKLWLQLKQATDYNMLDSINADERARLDDLEKKRMLGRRGAEQAYQKFKKDMNEKYNTEIKLKQELVQLDGKIAESNLKILKYDKITIQSTIDKYNVEKKYHGVMRMLNGITDEATFLAKTEAAFNATNDPKTIEALTEKTIANYELLEAKKKVAGIKQTGGTTEEDAKKTSAAANKAASEAAKWAKYLAKQSQQAYDNQIDLLSATEAWETSLSGIAGIVNDISKAFKNLALVQLKSGKAQAKLDDDKKENLIKFAGNSEKVAKVEADYKKNSQQLSDDLFTAQIDGYAAVAGAMAGAFAEGSTGAKAFMGIQQALALYNAVVAVTNAWALGYPANLVAVPATSAAVAALLSQIGQTFSGSGGGNTLSDAEIAQAEGVTGVQSDSVANILGSIDWSTSRSLTYTKGIYDSMTSLDAMTDRIGVTIGSFEGMSVSDGNRTYDLVRSGITINPASLAELEAGIITGATTAAVKRTKTGTFGGVEESIKYYDFGGLNSDLTAQLGEAYGSGIDALRGAASALGMSEQEFSAAAANWETSIQNLNFMDKTQEEIADMINGAIGMDLDSLASIIGGNVADYQMAGEGLFETMVRVAYEFEQVQESFEKLGGALVITGSNALEVSQELIAASGGIENLLGNINGYIDNFYDESEKQALRIAELTESGLFGDEEAYKARVEVLTALSSSGDMVAAEQLAELLRLQDTYREYFDENIRLEEERLEAEEEAQAKLDAVNERYLALVADRTTAAEAELAFHEGILNKIIAAYSGASNYMNSLEQSSALGTLAEAQLASGDSQGYFDTLYSQLALDKKTSTTREEYAVQFDRYIAELQSAEYEPATLNDVVESLDAILEQNQDIEDAIRTSSYQSPIGV